MCCRIICVMCMVAALLGTASGVPASPAVPADSRVNQYIYELRLREVPGLFPVCHGPHTMSETAAWLEGMSPSEFGPRGRWLYGMLEAEFRDEIRLLGSAYGWTADLQVEGSTLTGSRSACAALGRLAYYSPLGLSFWTSLRASVNASGLHKVETKPWRERGRASVDFAGVAFSRDGFSLSLERGETSWGAERRAGLLFSGTAPSFDMLKLTYRRDQIGFASFHTRLRKGAGEDPDGNLRRFVSAHRVEVYPTDMISLSISEAVIYGGEFRTFEPIYLNPLIVFYADQWNSRRNDNILIAGDFSLLFPRVAEIRGEVMVDDFQYDISNEPHEFGAGIYVTAVNPLSPATSMIGASYYHIRNQTYGHLLEWNRFIHEDVVMGYPDGPDGDRLAMWLMFASPEDLEWRFDYTLKRRGEGRAADEQEARGPKVKFPSGTVETGHTAGLEVTWRPSYSWLLGARAEYHHINNVGNRRGLDDAGWEVALNARFVMRPKSWWKVKE